MNWLLCSGFGASGGSLFGGNASSPAGSSSLFGGSNSQPASPFGQSTGKLIDSLVQSGRRHSYNNADSNLISLT